MNCSKCGYDNPDDTKKCQSCGFDLIHPNIQQTKQKTSKLAVFSLLLSILSFYFSIITGLAAILFGYKSLLKIRKSEGKLKGKSIAKAAIIASVILMGLNRLIFMDASPIENDYTMDYFGKPDSNSLKSFVTLQSLGDNKRVSGAPAIGLSEEDLGMIKAIGKALEIKDPYERSRGIIPAEHTIMDVWQHAEKGRNILSKLDSYPKISELSEPDIILKNPSYTKNLQTLFTIYWLYINLQIDRGFYQEALKELSFIDSINKKMIIGSRNPFTKKTIMSSICLEIEAVNLLANNPYTPNDVLSALKPMIDSYSWEHVSFKKFAIFEYLTFKAMLSKMKLVPLLKYNSTLRMYKCLCQSLMLSEKKPELNVWPEYYQKLSLIKNLTFDDNFELLYKLYNPYGYFLTMKKSFILDHISSIGLPLICSIDMIKIILNKRLGNEENYKTLGKRKNYIFDIEKKRIYTNIPNYGEFGLPINPKVLGLNENELEK